MRLSRLGLALVLTACAATAGCAGPLHPPAPGGAGVADVNPHSRDAVRDGGALRWPLDALPENFNYHQVDGVSAATRQVTGALLPMLFRDTENGGVARDPDYLSSAEVTATDPQTVTYRINPRAVWSNGQPITWHDFAAQWSALNGADPAYHVANTTGYSEIASVRPGTDNQQVVVRFARPFAEWRSLFTPLYPASTDSDPATFNTGWEDALPITSGPFEVKSLDRAAKTLTLTRSRLWWSTPAKLSEIIFRVVDQNALPDALAHNQIDFYPIGSDVELLRRAQTIPGVAVRQSPERVFNQITFNGGPGQVLADRRLRRAVARGIDRTAIATMMQGQITPAVTETGNSIYPFGSEYYHNHSRLLRFDAAAANHDLDMCGWLRSVPGGIRSRHGQQLRLRLLEPALNPVGERIDRALVDRLARIGVGVDIVSMPFDDAESAFRHGEFDLAVYAWQNTATPLAGARGEYAEPHGDDIQQNYGRIYDPAITTLFNQADRELDDAQRAAIGNKIDKLIWHEVHHLPLYPATGAYAVRSALANFGAPGFADIDYINAGYLK